MSSPRIIAWRVIAALIGLGLIVVAVLAFRAFLTALAAALEISK